MRGGAARRRDSQSGCEGSECGLLAWWRWGGGRTGPPGGLWSGTPHWPAGSPGLLRAESQSRFRKSLAAFTLWGFEQVPESSISACFPRTCWSVPACCFVLFCLVFCLVSLCTNPKKYYHFSTLYLAFLKHMHSICFMVLFTSAL